MSPIVSKMDAPIAPWDRPSAPLPHLNAEARRFIEKITRFVPAECSTNCDDPHCHYTHSDTWFVDGEPFNTLAEAEAASERKPDFIDIGGEVMAAGFRISACGKTLMSGPNDIALADLRAAHAAIGRQIQIMESGNG